MGREERVGEEKRRRAWMAEENADGDGIHEEGGVAEVTSARVEKRVELQKRLDAMGSTHRAVPDTEPHRYMVWEEDGERVWHDATGAGYPMLDEEALREDALMRLMMRSSEFEMHGGVRTASGQRVELDHGTAAGSTP